MLCEKCGKEVKAGAKFCDKCGAPIQQKEKMILPKIDKRVLYVMVSVLGICAVVVVLFGISRVWKYMFPPADGKLVKVEEWDGSWTEFNYDETGNLVKQIRYNEDGNISTSIDKVGWSDYNRQVDCWIEYSYDEAGNLMKEIHHKSDGDVSYWLSYSYDEAGSQIVIRDYAVVDGGDILRQWWEKSYDSSGNLVKEAHEFSSASTYFAGDRDETEYSYDSSGNLIKETKSYSDGSGHKTEYSYDNSGNLMGEINQDYRGNRSVKKYSYDDAGRLIKESNGYSDGWTDYSYDKKGNLVTKTYYYTSRSDPDIYEYSYDRAGNLIKEVRHIHDRSDIYLIKYTYK